MSKDKLLNTTEQINGVVVTVIDPVHNERGQLSYGFKVTLNNIDYSFRTNQQNLIQLNGEGDYKSTFVLNDKSATIEDVVANDTVVDVTE